MKDIFERKLDFLDCPRIDYEPCEKSFFDQFKDLFAERVKDPNYNYIKNYQEPDISKENDILRVYSQVEPQGKDEYKWLSNDIIVPYYIPEWAYKVDDEDDRSIFKINEKVYKDLSLTKIGNKENKPIRMVANQIYNFDVPEYFKFSNSNNSFKDRYLVLSFDRAFTSDIAKIACFDKQYQKNLITFNIEEFYFGIVFKVNDGNKNTISVMLQTENEYDSAMLVVNLLSHNQANIFNINRFIHHMWLENMIKKQNETILKKLK